MSPVDDFFRSRLDQMIDLRHPLAVLASRLPSRQLPRKQYSTNFKREVVEQSFERNASMAANAHENGINANILWRWRHEYAAGKFGSIEQTAFLPVTIEQSEKESLKDTAPEPTGYLELQIGAARLIIHGSPDRMVLKSVIEELR